MIVSHRHRFIFIKTHKTAGTSVEVLLSQIAGEDAIVSEITPPEPSHVPRNWRRLFNPVPEVRRKLRGGGLDLRGRGLRGTYRDLRRRRAYYNHMSAQLVVDRLGRRMWDEYFTFCFERNSWDKAVSWYFHTTSGEEPRPTIDEWVRERRALDSDWPLYASGGRIAVDFVGRYENLEEDLGHVLARVGVDSPIELPRAKGQHRPRDEKLVLTDLVRSRVEEVFRREIAHFGYVPPWPG